MTTTTIDTTPVATNPHGHSQHVGCRWCGAKVGEPCTTRDGRQAREAHERRRSTYRSRARSGRALMRAVVDDPGYFAAGDLLVCELSRWDPSEKVTVLQVVATGTDPNRSAYKSAVHLIRLLTADDERQLGLIR